MKEYKIYDSCFGRSYDANIKECKNCEVAEECKLRLIEYSKKRRGGGKVEGSSNPFRLGTAMYVCYENLRQGGTFKALVFRITEELKKRKIRCINVPKRLREVLYECRQGKTHRGGELIYSVEDKIYKVVDKNI